MGVAVPPAQRQPPARAGRHPTRAPGLGTARASMGAGDGEGGEGGLALIPCWPRSK